MHIVIIGNGIAGISAANKIRELDSSVRISVISDESQYFYSRPALMYIYMRELNLKHTVPFENKYWDQKRIKLIADRVTSVDFQNKTLMLKNRNDIKYNKLILATGSKGNRWGWKGENLPGVQCFTNLQELNELEKRTSRPEKINRVVIVGGGLIGIEVAEMMIKRKIPVTMLVREETYWPLALSPDEGRMIQEEIEDHDVDLRMITELDSVIAGKDGEAAGVLTGNGERIDCSIVVLTAGVSPNIDFLHNSELDIGRGIRVNRKLETNIPDVYAAGDCAEIKSTGTEQRDLVEQLWYTGKMQGEVLGQNILGAEIEYDRGIWYNSARFFSIDFHTYGQVNQNVKDEQEYYFRIPGEKKSIRIIYLKDRVIGFNTLGIRYRDEVCRKWIEEKRTPEYVLEHLDEANFDSEFSKKYEEDMKKRLLREYKVGKKYGRTISI